METVEREIRDLRHARGGVLRGCIGATGCGAALFALAPSLPAAAPEVRFVGLAALALFSLAAVRTIADTLQALEQPCPRCHRPFFGGARSAPRTLPLLPRACGHCALPL